MAAGAMEAQEFGLLVLGIFPISSVLNSDLPKQVTVHDIHLHDGSRDSNSLRFYISKIHRQRISFLESH